MPGKDSEDKSLKIWPGIFYLVGFLTLYAFSSSKPDEPVPLPPVRAAVIYPTQTAIPLHVSPSEHPMDGFSVVVLNQEGKPFEPFSNVIVRVSDSSFVDSGEDGQLIVPPCTSDQILLAWAADHYSGSARCNAGVFEPITLIHLSASDNLNYVWISAETDCVQCHANQFSLAIPTNEPLNQTVTTYDEINEWLKSGHAKVFDRRYFETMYRGISMSGKNSQVATPVIIDNSIVPIPPEFNPDYHGPGFKLDFPRQPGNCAYCHAPSTILPSQESPDLSTLFPTPGGVWGEAVTCDICHKVYSVILADNGLPFPDRPGILSFRFLRPQNELFMTGPFTNILTKRDGSLPNHRSTCSPIFSQSEFCAPCHFGKFGDMVIYNSYGEWKASPYAANKDDPGYRTCQDCHMSHMAVGDTNSLSSQRQACSANNTSFRNFNHNMMDFGSPGSGDEIPLMVQDAAEIAVNFGFQATGTNSLDITVQVTNTQAGHKFPTDSPLRHLILEVSAKDRVDTSLIQVGGERIPNWAGPAPGSPVSYQQTLKERGVENYSGKPGKVFANLLVEEDTNLSPGMAYWNETKHAFVNPSARFNSDNRLQPRVPDLSTYSFAVPDAGDVTIVIKLIYRFAFYDLMVQKEWFDRGDIVVSTVQCKGPAARPDLLRQSCVKIAP